jgi:predicted molibdopterin-dependent oxidoreductase YjgC
VLIALGEKADYHTASEVFSALAAAKPPFAGMSFDSLGLKGTAVAGAVAGASR